MALKDDLKPRVYLLGSILLLFTLSSCSQEMKNENELLQIINGKDEIVDRLIKDPINYRVQILYTQIERDSLNNPLFRSLALNINENTYFYPASTVKMPTAFMALEKLNELDIKGLDKGTRMVTDSAYSGQSSVFSDTTSITGYPSVQHYIKKIFLVSDNDAYNRLYEFLGQEYLNEGLKKKGFNNVRLTHRLEIFLTKDQNQATNPVRFYNGDTLIYQQPLVKSGIDFTWPEPIRLGKGYYLNNELINEPMDFSMKNFIPLSQMQRMLQVVLFPEVFDTENRFNLTSDDYRFVYKYMSMYPRESKYPKLDSTYYDSYVKFFMFGDSKDPIPENIRIFNKVGDAYGFLIDNAYIVDFDNRIEFLLSAVIQVNSNQIYNDGMYEYDEIGFPFMAKLGKIIYDFELTRHRKYRPDLRKFRINYSE